MNTNISDFLKTPEIPPVLLNLNFTSLSPLISDCDAAGRFAAEFDRLLSQDTTTLPLTSLAIFLHSYSDIALTNITQGQLGDWLASIANSIIYRYTPHDKQIHEDAHQFFSYIKANCEKSFCRNIEWAGDPDLSGIGFYVTYILMTVLATLFSIIYAFHFLRWARKEERLGKPHSVWSGLASFQPPPEWKQLSDSLRSFWVFSVYFAYGITIAGFTLDRFEESDVMSYRHWFSYREAHLSLMLLMSLWPWYRKQSTYPRFTIISLAILFIILAATKYGDSDFGVWVYGNDEGSLYESWNCAYVEDKTLDFSNATYHAQFVLLIWIGHPILSLLEAWISAKTIRKCLKSLRRCIPILTAALAFVFMWIDLAIFVRSRNELNHNAGSSYQENKWTFGQVAAVTTMLPLVADFYRTWLWDHTMLLYEAIIPSWMRVWIEQQLSSVQKVQSTQADVEKGIKVSDVEEDRTLSTLHTEGSESQHRLIGAAG